MVLLKLADCTLLSTKQFECCQIVLDMCTRTSVKSYFIKLVTSFYKQNKQFIVIDILFSIYAKFGKAGHLKLFIATELWVKFTS